MEESINVEIPNWEKFNPRSDRANYSWFRFQNDFFTDQAIYLLTTEERLFYVFLLCEASKRNNPKFEVFTEYASSLTKMPIKKVLACFERIRALKLVCGVKPSLRRHNDGFEPSLLPATNERTNVTNVTNERYDSSELEKIQLVGSIPEFSGDSVVEGLLASTKHNIQQSWLKTYPDREWIAQELLKAHNWLLLNPKKAPKVFGRFMNNWLARGWEARRKAIPTNKVPDIDYEKISRGALWDEPPGAA